MREVRAARAAAVDTAVDIAATETQIAELTGRRAARRAQLATRLLELKQQKLDREAVLDAAANNAKPLQDLAGHPDTHDAAIRDAIQHRDTVRERGQAAAAADRSSLGAANRSVERFRRSAADTDRLDALVPEQNYRTTHQDRRVLQTQQEKSSETELTRTQPHLLDPAYHDGPAPQTSQRDLER